MQRFRVGFSRIPAMRAVGQMYNEDAGKALVEAKLQGETIARELSSFGIDLCFAPVLDIDHGLSQRSEEHTSELQSLMRISYAVFCLKKKHKNQKKHTDKSTQ